MIVVITAHKQVKIRDGDQKCDLASMIDNNFRQLSHF